jgi:hypothetical protein
MGEQFRLRNIILINSSILIIHCNTTPFSNQQTLYLVIMSDTYKPTDHDGLKQDGTPDKRVGTGEFAGGKVDPHEAGKQGGRSSGGSRDDYDEDSGSGSKKQSGSGSGGEFRLLY